MGSDLFMSNTAVRLTDTTEVVPVDAGLACSVNVADSVLLGISTPHLSDTVGAMVMHVQVYDRPVANPAPPVG